MRVQKEVIVIVGGYSTGQYLAPNFVARGYQCVHVQPGANLIPYFLSSYRADCFIKNIIWDDNDDEVLKELLKFKVKIIIPGCEAAVLLADRLSDRMGLFTTNEPSLSAARRDKYLMQEALKKAGLAHIKHYKSNDLGSIMQWIEESKLAYPVVIKPVASGGTDGVSICHNAQEVKKAFANVYGTQNYLGLTNTEVLAQEFLYGSEYVVNTVSYDGQHFVTDVLKVHKRLIDNSPAYDYAELLSPVDNQDVYARLTAYIRPALDALGIKFGPAHSEIMMGDHTGPTLIETAARVIGGIDPSAYTEALGYNQISVTVEAYVNPNGFSKILITEGMQLVKYLICVFLISPFKGMIENTPDVREILDLKFFHSLTLQDSGELKKTSNLIDCPGFVNLLSKNKQDLRQDYTHCRNIEKNMFAKMIGRIDHD